MRNEIEKIRDKMEAADPDSESFEKALKELNAFLDADREAERIVSTRGFDPKGHGWWENSYKAHPSIVLAVRLMKRGRDPDLVCNHCGEPVELSVEEDMVVANTECSFPHGVPDSYSIDIDVPSGKLVFANDLRDFYEWAPDFDINSLKGQMKSAMFYGDQGLGFGHIGNSCPSIFQDGRSIHIGNPGYNDDMDEVIDPIPGERVGGVATDVWSFSVADYDDLSERGWDSECYPTIKTKPGKYRLTIYPHVNREKYDHKTKELFATIKRVI